MDAVTLLAAALNLPPSEIGPALTRETCPSWDSFAHLNLMLSLERHYGIPLNDRTLGQYATFDAVDTLCRSRPAA